MAAIPKRRRHQDTPSCQLSMPSTCDMEFDTKGKLGMGRWGCVYRVNFPGGKYKGLRALKLVKKELEVCSHLDFSVPAHD
jgi:hypothetical protein